MQYGTLVANPKGYEHSSFRISDAYCECAKRQYCEDVSLPITKPVIGFEYSETQYDHRGRELKTNQILFNQPIDPNVDTFIRDLEAAFAACVVKYEVCIKVYGSKEQVRHIGQSEVKWIVEGGEIIESSRHCRKVYLDHLVLPIKGTTGEWLINGQSGTTDFDFAYADTYAENTTVASNAEAALKTLFDSAGIQDYEIKVLPNAALQAFDVNVLVPQGSIITVDGKPFAWCGDKCVYAA